MSEINQKTEIHNLELMIGTLKQEANEQAKELSSIYEEIQLARSARDMQTELSERIMRSVDDAHRKLKGEKDSLRHEREKMDDERKAHANEIKRLKTEEKGAIKQLGWVNDKVLKADAEYEGLEQENEGLKTEIDRKKALVDATLDLTSEIEDLQLTKMALVREISDIESSHGKKLEILRKELSDINENSGKAVARAEEAEYTYRNLNTEIDRKRRDVSIVVTRLEQKYGEAFPNLRLKI